VLARALHNFFLAWAFARERRVLPHKSAGALEVLTSGHFGAYQSLLAISIDWMQWFEVLAVPRRPRKQHYGASNHSDVIYTSCVAERHPAALSH
jgi:hypothetical protein